MWGKKSTRARPAASRRQSRLAQRPGISMLKCLTRAFFSRLYFFPVSSQRLDERVKLSRDEMRARVVISECRRRAADDRLQSFKFQPMMLPTHISFTEFLFPFWRSITNGALDRPGISLSAVSLRQRPLLGSCGDDTRRARRTVETVSRERTAKPEFYDSKPVTLVAIDILPFYCSHA